MAAATLAQTATRLAHRGVRTRLAVELSVLGDSADGRYVPCPWCGRPAGLLIVLELVPVADDGTEADPVGSAEVERALCRGCVDRYVRDGQAPPSSSRPCG